MDDQHWTNPKTTAPAKTLVLDSATTSLSNRSLPDYLNAFQLQGLQQC
jgi:hypothetical protein